jgi:hypothetical protein
MRIKALASAISAAFSFHSVFHKERASGSVYFCFVFGDISFIFDAFS